MPCSSLTPEEKAQPHLHQQKLSGGLHVHPGGKDLPSPSKPESGGVRDEMGAMTSTSAWDNAPLPCYSNSVSEGQEPQDPTSTPTPNSKKASRRLSIPHPLPIVSVEACGRQLGTPPTMGMLKKAEWGT